MGDFSIFPSALRQYLTYYVSIGEYLDQIKDILTANPETIDEVGTNGQTLIHAAVASGKIQFVQYLVSAGSQSLNAYDNDHRTPLMVAAIRGHFEMMQVLIDLGANIQAVNARGDSLVHIAAQYEDMRLLILMSENGADLSLPNRNGLTPLDMAIRAGSSISPEVCLRDNKQSMVGWIGTRIGIRLSESVVRNEIRLHWILKYTDPPTLRYLLQSAIDVPTALRIRSSDGKLAHEYAMDPEHQHLLRQMYFEISLVQILFVEI